MVPTHLQFGTRRRLVVSTTLQLLYPTGKERSGTHCTGGVSQGGVSLDGTENLRSARI
jgi:hypothetical protein